MPASTIYRISEQAFSLIEGGNPAAASSISFNELKIAAGQIINSLLKVEHFSINEKIGERIPNGSVLGLYEGIAVTQNNGKSKASLPIKPLKLPRNMGIYAIYPKYELNGNYEYDKEFIPLQMGQAGLLKSQPLLNDLIGQVGYENFGLEVVFTKSIKELFPNVVLAMRLAIMDISQYSDYDILPILPEQEWQVIQELFKSFSVQPIRDAVVDSSVKEQKGMPVKQQQQTP